MRNNVESGAVHFSRRDFLKFPLGLAAASISGSGAEAERDEIILLLNPNIMPVNMSNIIKALKSDIPVGKGNYAGDFLNLIQKNNKELTGMTIQQQMERNFRRGENHSDIEIKMVEGLRKNEAIAGKFSHNQTHPNRADIDSGYIVSRQKIGPSHVNKIITSVKESVEGYMQTVKPKRYVY